MVSPLLALLLLVLLPPSLRAFNADVNHAVVYHAASEDLLFGYSVALASSGQLLVGEPRGSWPSRDDVHQPGALYRCGLSSGPLYGRGAEGRLECVSVLEGKNDAAIGGQHVKNLHNDSMFASTVVTTSAGLTLVCGPGWKNQLFTQMNPNEHYLMNGLCYSLGTTRPYAPLVDTAWQGATVANKRVFNYAFGEAGFSAHVSQDAGEVLLGAPGVMQWRGSAIRYRISPSGQLIEGVVSSTDSLEENSYFGYSVTAGRFRGGPGTRVQYAAGAPRAALTGKVVLFELPEGATGHGVPVLPLQEEFGEQLGEYFGAAVLAEDVTGDGQADLLVGAPLHTTPDRGDEGRVYVFLNVGEGRLRRTDSPLIPARRANPAHQDKDDQGDYADHGPRFGTAIAAAGDVNQDGFNDVWVGAPYEDGGRGAVYLFLGSRTGLRSSQRVAARDVDPRLRSFGFSAAGCEDLDGNGYPDLAVGAPLSGRAVVLLTRPAARLVARIIPSAKELAFAATSMVLSACLEYTGARAQRRAVASVSLALDGPSGQLDRAHLQMAGRPAARQVHYNQNLVLDSRSCTDVTVLIRPGIEDFTIPIDVTMRFNLTDEASHGDRPFCRACPVVDPAAPTTASLKIPYATGCANDTICQPDLSVAVEWHGTRLPLLLGSSRHVTLRVVVHNAGEPAFLAKLAVLLPARVGVARLPAACHAPQDSAAALLLCDVANPLGRGQKVALDLPLDVFPLALAPDATKPFLDVVVNATSAANSRDARPADNVLTVTLPIAAVVNVDVVGRAAPELVLLPQQSSAKAVRFTHTYEVLTRGPTPVEAVSLRVLLPARARVGGRLLPLLQWQVDVDNAPAACEVTEAVTEHRSRLAAARPVEGDVQDAVDLRCGARPVECVWLVCQLSLQQGSSTRVDLNLGLLVENLGVAVSAAKRVVAVHTEGVVTPPRVAQMPAGTNVTVALPVRLRTPFIRLSDAAPVQPWVVGLSVAAGLLVLCLLTLALHKAGFFSRRKVPPAGDGVLAPAPGEAAVKAAGVGPAADDALLARTDATVEVEDVDPDVLDTGSDSGMSSTLDAVHASGKESGSG